MNKNEPFSIKKFFTSLSLLIIACFGFVFITISPLKSIGGNTITYFFLLILKLLAVSITIIAQLYLTYYLLVLLLHLIRKLISFIYTMMQTFFQKFVNHQ
ncbi:hypothetical protein C6503_06915 [Candidatus Poribacteria bacterium]|nr:MAG: hypothetical protein C6503_06915 [Candidatus Poribacteria bacterium]